MTGEDHKVDALLAALTSPALPAEQVGGAAAVAAMVNAQNAPVPASVSGIRSRRRVAIATVTVASLGVGGLVAAGPGIFSPAADRPELAPRVTEAEVDDSVDESSTDEGTILVGEDLVVTTLPVDGAIVVTTSPATRADRRPAATGDIECAEGNHGQTVSSIAKAADPEDGKGDEVSAAAHSDCGKDTDDKSTKDDKSDKARKPAKSPDDSKPDADEDADEQDNDNDKDDDAVEAEEDDDADEADDTADSQPATADVAAGARAKVGGAEIGAGVKVKIPSHKPGDD